MTKERGGRREAEEEPRGGDSELFRAEMRDVRPSRPHNRVVHAKPGPRPIPTQRLEDERAVLIELSRLAFDSDDIEFEDDTVFLRPGLPREILRKLRRTHWVIQDDIDLHGLTGDAAVEATAGFLNDCKRRGLRCVRIVHGKGLGVLKAKLKRWLPMKDEVLAFTQAPAAQGGSGALLVLLRG